jgi:integrase
MSGMEEYGRELCRHLLAKRNFQPIVAHVEIIASFHGLCLRPSTPEFDGLAGALLEHLSTTYRPGEENMATLLRPVISPRLTAQPEQPPQSQSASPNRSTASAEAATQAESVQEPAYTVRDAFETWCRQKKATHKLKLDWGLAVSRWEKLHGLKPIAEITSKDVKRYRNTLTLLPARAPADLAARPFLEQIEIADEEDLPRLANQTVNKSLSCIRVMLEHAVDEEIIESNVAASVKGLDRDEEPRAQFEDAELKKIFYWLTKPTGERSTVGGTDLLETDEGLWVPTLALHGMRLREILQLRVEDICVEDGFHHMVVRHKPRRQQSTKTKASRLVPIHSRIREAGFLDFVDERRRSRAAWVFARTERDGAEQLAKEFSRQFGRFLDGTVGISDPDKVFHSFRHTLKALCRRAKMSEEIHDKLTGHSGGGTGRRYGAMTSLDVLDDAVQTVTLDMIDWSAFSANGCL